MSLVSSVCQPSTLRMLICPEASKARNSMAAVSAEGRTIYVLIRRLNYSCWRARGHGMRLALVDDTVPRGA